jgi:hypothetical protein
MAPLEFPFTPSGSAPMTWDLMYEALHAQGWTGREVERVPLLPPYAGQDEFPLVCPCLSRLSSADLTAVRVRMVLCGFTVEDWLRLSTDCGECPACRTFYWT